MTVEGTDYINTELMTVDPGMSYGNIYDQNLHKEDIQTIRPLSKEEV